MRLAFTALFALLLLATGPAASLSAEDSDCLPILQQAEQMLVEAEGLLTRGADAKAQGVAIRGLGLVDRAAALCPGSLDVPRLGVLLSVFAGDSARGREWLARYAASTAHRDRDPQLHYLKALVEVRLVGRPDLAIRSLERMQALAPGVLTSQRDSLYYEALMAHGLALAAEGRHDEAMRLQDAAESLARRTGKPGRARRARAAKAVSLGQDQRFLEASTIFRSLAQEEPQSPIWPYQLGLMLGHLLDHDGAIAAYRHSLELQPGFQAAPDVLADLARARMRLGNSLRLKAGRMADAAAREALVAEGLQELSRYQQENPRDPLGAFWLGVLCFEDRDKPLEALGWFERAFALDPDCPTTLDYLIQAHARAGGPVPPDQPAASPEAMAAWEAKGEAWRKDRDENADRRKKVLDERVRKTGDESGGCM
jgi:tetratricopeptide (TPR) repeat protein